MSIRVDEALGVHVRALQVRTQRSEILAANLANQDTPGFLARDIDFAGEMQRLDPHSEDADLAFADEPAQLKYRIPNQPSEDGNSVEQGVEQAEFSRNVTGFQTSLTFLGMNFRGLKQAIEGR